MKRQHRAVILLSALLTVAWGTFLIEDGLFNAGSADAKEFGIGLAFLIPAFVFLMLGIKKEDLSVPRWSVIGLLIVLGTAYTGFVYSRWQSREENAGFAVGTDMIVGHVETENEWIMLDRSMLKRPAHWYESGVQVTYLADDEQRSLSIQLPAKYLPLKSLKEL